MYTCVQACHHTGLCSAHHSCVHTSMLWLSGPMHWVPCSSLGFMSNMGVSGFLPHSVLRLLTCPEAPVLTNKRKGF